MASPGKITRRTFDPHSPSHRGLLWVKIKTDEGRFRYIFWGRILRLTILAATCGWLLLTLGVWEFVKYGRGIDEVRYVDLVAPWRWGRYRASLAAHYFSRARNELGRHQTTAGYSDLLSSLSLAPGNTEIRHFVGAVQFEAGLRTEALATLRQGLPTAAADEGYLRDFFRVADDLRADREAVAAGVPLLPATPDTVHAHAFVALQVATARYNLGDYEGARNLLTAWKLGDTPEGVVLEAECDWDQGLGEQAIRRLERALPFSRSKDQIAATLESFSRQLGQMQEVYGYSLMRELADPSNPLLRIDLLDAERHAGRTADEGREIAAYCSDFKSNRAALERLVEFAVNTGQPDLVRRAEGLAGLHDLAPAIAAMTVAQSCVVARSYPPALAAIAQAQKMNPPPSKGLEAILAGLKAVALAGEGNGGADLAFTDFLSLAGALSRSEGLFLDRQFQTVGRESYRRQLLDRVCAAHPDDGALLAELVRIDAAAGDRSGLIANLPAFLRTRKPARDALEAAVPLLDRSKDAALLGRVRDALAHSPAALPAGGV